MAKQPLQTKLLPLNANPIENALDEVAAQRLAFDLSPADVRPLSCPKTLLPWLAAQWRVTIDGLNEAEQRQLIANALDIHRYKGTVHAVQKALNSVFNQVTVMEHQTPFVFDARVQLKSDINALYNSDKFSTARTLVNAAKNARSRFRNFEISLPAAHCAIDKTDACNLHLRLHAPLALKTTTQVNLQGAIQWML